jgi:hypothetical protein
VSHPAARALTNTTWGLGALKILLAEATYVIQDDSQIGDWELAIKILDPPNDGQGVHEITHPLGSK